MSTLAGEGEAVDRLELRLLGDDAKGQRPTAGHNLEGAQQAQLKPVHRLPFTHERTHPSRIQGWSKAPGAR